jgi:hypothetical protein
MALNAAGEEILVCLHEVAAQRVQRQQDPQLGRQVLAVKAYQHARFMLSYADMLAHPRFGAAARFFLDDLYGPGDFTTRDSQFVRIVPALVRLFPRDIVDTVLALGRLHALSERLDTAMGRCAAGLVKPEGGPAITGRIYGECWRQVGGVTEREQQITLMLAVGVALEGYTRKPLLRHSLRLMRGPALAAGLGELQTFLERGFDTFRAMQGSSEFVDTIARRERTLAAELFAGADAPALSP